MIGESMVIEVEQIPPAPTTIADGFSGRRYARGIDRRSELLSKNLVRIAVEHPGVNLHLPSWDPLYPDQADVKVVKKRVVQSRSSRLGKLDRSTVYRTIRGVVPSVHRDLPVTAQSLAPRDETTTPGGARLIVAEFDPDPETELDLELQDIGSALADLAGRTLADLRWPRYSPNLRLVYVPEDVPEDTYEELRGVVETFLPFRLMLSPARLEPRLDLDLPQPGLS